MSGHEWPSRGYLPEEYQERAELLLWPHAQKVYFEGVRHFGVQVCEQRPSEGSRGHQEPSETIRGQQRASEATMRAPRRMS